ncbi:M48 family metallopeptidase [bacterium]|nr:M48 family metallopeptidase [bacterium]
MQRFPAFRAPHLFAILAILAGLCLCLSSCLTIDESMGSLASQALSAGVLDQYQATMLRVAAQAAADAARQITPEEEYYVGRAVAASIFAVYKSYDRPELADYLNRLGQGLALSSSRPAIYAGYHFAVLDSPEVNAFASPGGHILVTRGLLARVGGEDELAAALAHEIAHVALGHGLASVQGMRIAQIASDYAIEAGKSSGGELEAFSSAFGSAIAELAKIILFSGYSQNFELQADQEARAILYRSGYDPNALARLIAKLPARGEESGGGFAATHPAPLSRLEALRAAPFEPPALGTRGKRFWPAPRAAESAVGASALAGAERDPVRTFYVRAERFAAMRALF